MVMPEEPPGEVAPLPDRFQKVRQSVRPVVRIELFDDTAGGAVGQNTVHRPVCPLQICQGLAVFLRAGQFFRPPGHALHPEHGPQPAHQPILPLEVRVGGVQDAVLDVVGGRAAHGEPGEAAEGEDLSPHQVQDVFPHHMDPTAVPLSLRERVQQGKILVVSIYEQRGKGLFLQPVQPILVFMAPIPQPSKVACDDHIVLTAHVFLLGEVSASKPLEAAVGVTRDVDRHLPSPSSQGHLLLSRQGDLPLSEFRAGCRANSTSILGFRCYQFSLLNELLHQLPHIAVCQVVFSILVAEPMDRELFHNAPLGRPCDIQIFPLGLVPLQDGLYRNVFSVTPRSKVKLVAKMLKAIHAQESKKAAREKTKAVVEQLRSMKLKEAAKKVENGIEETLTYCDFPSEHWTRIRTNNVIERLNREIRRRTRVVGSFPDGNSALMLVCARLRHVAGTQWGNKKYMNMKHLEAAIEDVSIAG